MTEPRSVSTAMDLAHEVRTAINHILGYATILIDASEEQGMPELVAFFEEIYAGGIDLLGRTQAHASSDDFIDLRALQAELSPLAEHILSEIEDLALPASHREMLQDAEVVANACRRLLSLVQSA